MVKTVKYKDKEYDIEEKDELFTILMEDLVNKLEKLRLSNGV